MSVARRARPRHAVQSVMGTIPMPHRCGATHKAESLLLVATSCIANMTHDTDSRQAVPHKCFITRNSALTLSLCLPSVPAAKHMWGEHKLLHDLQAVGRRPLGGCAARTGLQRRRCHASALKMLLPRWMLTRLRPGGRTCGQVDVIEGSRRSQGVQIGVSPPVTQDNTLTQASHFGARPCNSCVTSCPVMADTVFPGLKGKRVLIAGKGMLWARPRSASAKVTHRVPRSGGSTGIGAASAHIFSASGAAVCIVGRSEEKCSKTADSLPSKGMYSAGDLTKPEDCARVVREAVSHLGGLDVLVNVGKPGPLAGQQLA